MAFRSKQQPEQSPISKEEGELLAKIADIILSTKHFSGLKLVKSEARQSQCLCTEKDGELLGMMELRKNNITGHLQVMAHGNDVAENVRALLKENQIGFTDHGIIINLITPWQCGLFSGLEFPTNLSLNVQNFGPVKMIPGAVRTLPKEKENRMSFNLSINLTEIAAVIACPEEKFVDQVEINLDEVGLVMAACEDYEFPFKGFVQRALSRQKYPPTGIEKLVSIKRKELSEFAEALRRSTADRSGWKKMTDPCSHDPSRYLYLVHSLSRNGYANFESEEVKQEYLRSYDGRDPLGKPDLFVKRSGISCSLICRGIPGVADHTATWGDTGFILNVPPENIRTAHSSDTMPIIRKTDPKDYDSNLPSPEDVLRHSPAKLWNEVFVAGMNENTGSSIQIAGVFVCVDDKTGKPHNPHWAPRVIRFSEKREIPIVELPQQAYMPRAHLGD